MKNSGLKNRFPERVRHAWLYWWTCLMCRYNQANALHHILSPSSRLYIAGEHNKSIFNSCPLHNYLHPNARELQKKGCEGFGITKPCHVGNESHLYKDDTIKSLLKEVRTIMTEEIEIELDATDRDFLHIYAHLYK
jgi:hypothetical protein